MKELLNSNNIYKLMWVITKIRKIFYFKNFILKVYFILFYFIYIYIYIYIYIFSKTFTTLILSFKIGDFNTSTFN